MPFAHLTLATRDVSRTRRFFEATLGWRALERPGNIPYPSAWLEMGPGQELHLVEVADFAPSAFEREYGRHLAVRHPHADFADLKIRLAQHGAEVIAPQRPTAFERFFFRSPDGYLFEVIAEDSSP